MKKKKNPGKIRKALQENWQSVSQPFHYSEWLAHFPKERKKKKCSRGQWWKWTATSTKRARQQGSVRWLAARNHCQQYRRVLRCDHYWKSYHQTWKGLKHVAKKNRLEHDENVLSHHFCLANPYSSFRTHWHTSPLGNTAPSATRTLTQPRAARGGCSLHATLVSYCWSVQMELIGFC